MNQEDSQKQSVKKSKVLEPINYDQTTYKHIEISLNYKINKIMSHQTSMILPLNNKIKYKLLLKFVSSKFYFS